MRRHEVFGQAGRWLRWWLSGAVTALLCGCLGTPTPLAPSIGGSPGLPHRGTLQHGRQLPQRGPGYERFRGDDIRWGHPQLIGAVERAAASVLAQRPGGAPLVVADVSAQHGGKIARHSSHRSGRDVDLLFYVSSLDGRSIKNPGFVRFARDGLARIQRDEYVMLDVARTWLLVRALVLDEKAQLSWLFVARWVEALIIEYAIAQGEDLDVVWRAQQLLHQPGDSFPHDDHIHLRLACSPDDEVHGCVPNGRHWPWLPPALTLPAMSDDALLAALLEDGEPEPLAPR